ncbi:MAG: family 78 glycoside hydrolase catalytic domain, partial [Bacilli bacterium]|nr:family 78 glycoside hydrolase catalytic domain [Bacilli bacterium]
KQKQVNYRVLVSSTSSHNGDYWDSGVITSSKMFDIRYEGKTLDSRSEFFVKVITTNQDGEEASAETSFYTTLREDEWLGKWMSLPESFHGSSLLIRKRIELQNKPIKKAFVYIAAIGYHDFYLNGEKVGDAKLNPGVTDYDKTCLYNTYNILDLIKDKTDVVLGVEVGYGWYGNRKCLFQAYITYEDGEELEVRSAAGYGWWVTSSPILENSVYNGEIYDGRVEERYLPHWASEKFEPTWGNGWMYTVYVQKPLGKLTPMEIPPIRELKEYPSFIAKKFDDKDVVYAFKQNMAGWARIKVKGSRGSKVTLVFGEQQKPEDGHVNQTNLRSARASDTYILKGNGVETYAPHFTFHGFQFVEVLIEGEVEILEVIGIHAHTDLRSTGEFSCDDDLINHLHHMAKITEQNNQYSILSDCPQRDERFGWLNDVTSRVFQMVYNFDMDRMIAKVDHDYFETMNEEGCIADTAPYYTGGQPGDTANLSYLLIAWFAYRYYGDTELIRREYDGHKRWVEYLLTRQKDYIMDYYYYADWVNPHTLEDSFSDGICVSSMFLNWYLKVITDLAELTGHQEDAAKYSKLAKESDVALHKHYYHEEGYYSKNTQCENSMALWLGITPESEKEKVMKHIVDNIVKNNYHMTCGNQGYKHVFFLLCDYGYTDLALKILRNPEYPGWGYMVKCGATTVWERWEVEMGNEMHSFDHPMFGSYDAIFYRYLAGIKINDVTTEDIEISPVVADTINKVNCSFDSIRGLIVSNWVKEGDVVKHHIEIPTNTTVKVCLKNVVSVNGEKVNNLTQLESGSYDIVCSK